MPVNFNQFADGGVLKTTDRVVGVRNNTEANFDFPGEGFQDEDGNWHLKYSSAGPLAVNYLNITNSLSGEPVVIESEGTDANQSLLIRSLIDGSLTLQAPGLGNINLDVLGGGNLDIDTTSGFVDFNTTTPIKGVLDEDDMVSDSAQDVATQQSIKAYVDNAIVGSNIFTYITNLDETASLPNSDPLSPKATGIMASTTVTGAVNTRVLTGTANEVDIASGDGTANPTFSLSSTLVSPGTVTLGGDLFTNGNKIDGLSSTIEIVTTGVIDLSAPTVIVDAAIAHAGETTNSINFSTGVQDYQIGASSIMDINASGLRLNGAGSRFNEFSDDDTLASDSATTAVSERAIKSYVDGSSGALADLTYLTKLDQTASLPNSEPLATKATGIMSSTTATGEVETRVITGTVNEINVASGDGSANPTLSLSSTLVTPGTLTLGDDLFTNGNSIQGGVLDIELVTSGSAKVYLNTTTVAINANLVHEGDETNRILFATAIQEYQIDGLPIMNLNSLGVKLGSSGARFNEFSDDETLASDSATTAVSERAIKSYVDTSVAAILVWTQVTGTSQAMAVNNGYIANNAALVTLTLPASAAVGDTFRLVGKGAGLYRIAQLAGQTIHFGNQDTTTGAGGYIEATHRYDAIELLCTTSNNGFTVSSGPQGSFTVV